MKGLKKLTESSTFWVIVFVMTVTAFVAGFTEYTWTAWVDQLNIYIPGYVLKEVGSKVANAYQKKGMDLDNG